MTSDSRLDGSDVASEDMGMDAILGLFGMLGVILDETGVGVNDAASGAGDGSATLDDNAKLLGVCVGVLAGIASGIEPTRLIGDGRGRSAVRRGH